MHIYDSLCIHLEDWIQPLARFRNDGNDVYFLRARRKEEASIVIQGVLEDSKTWIVKRFRETKVLFADGDKKAISASRAAWKRGGSRIARPFFGGK